MKTAIAVMLLAVVTITCDGLAQYSYRPGDDQATITGYSGSRSDLTLAASIDGGLPTAIQGAATTYYVSDLAGNDASNGLAWSTAKKTIQAAIDAASDGDTVLVSNGVYYINSQLTLGKSLTLAGVGGPAATIIDGSNSCRCIIITGGTPVIDGFSIRNGFLSNDVGAGVRAVSGGVITNCHIYGNIASNADRMVHHEGGGLYVQGTTRVEDCRIFSNQTHSAFGGGGIRLHDSTRMRRCDVYGNFSGGSGAGVRATGSSRVEDCTIRDNRGYYGAGVNASGGAVYSRCRIYGNVPDGVWWAGGTLSDCLIYSNSPVGLTGAGTLRNCLIYGNAGPGVRLADAEATVENCTIANNDVGVAVSEDVVATNVFRNVILYGNATNHACYGGAVFACDYSCVDPLPAIGVGNINADPEFMDDARADFRLWPDSPCRETGTNLPWMASATAVRGQPRIFNGRVDMGADESVFLYVWQASSADGPGTDWDTAFHTIGQAVDAAVYGTMIFVAKGTYAITSPINITNALTLHGEGGSSRTMVNGSHTTGCFRISHPEAVVQNLTITNGYNTTEWIGGGVWMSAGTVRDCVIVGNRAYQGGGVWMAGGGEVARCTIRGNLAMDDGGSGTGGGVWFESGGVVRDTMIISNEAAGPPDGRGGGVRFYRGGLLVGCTVSGNTGRGGGGGSALRFDSGGLATNCTITGNTSADGGGVIRFSGGGTLRDCTISSNVSSGNAVFTDSPGGGTVVSCRITGNLGGSGPGGCSYMADCVISDNRATNGSGGGMTLGSGGMAVGCVIVSNSATQFGGGTDMGAGSRLVGCTVSGNTAGQGGGGINCNGGLVSNCTIIANRAWSGAGLNLSGGRLARSTISGNTATGTSGGGVFCSEGTMVEGCLVSDNSAPSGGGVELFHGGAVCNSMIVSNSAPTGGGGGVDCAGAGGTLTNCLIVGNAAFWGGGVKGNGGGRLENCTIAGNTANEGAGVHGAVALRNSVLYGNVSANGANYYPDPGADFTFTCVTPDPGGEGNIADNPQFAGAATGDYRLSATSPCIDAGTNQDWMAGTMDLDGKPRVIHGRVDMGAHEGIREAWDSDNDEIPDWWTWKFFGHLTGMAEDQSRATDSADGTGVKNLYKYVADLDPTNPASVFEIVAVSNTPPTHTVFFRASSNRVYSLMRSGSLSQSLWTVVEGQTNRTGNGALMQLVDADAASRLFYRIGVGRSGSVVP